MHESSSSITETNWFSWDIYLSSSTILAWLSQAEKHRNYKLKSSNHKNHSLKWNCLQRENYRRLGEPLVDLFPSYCFLIHFILCIGSFISLLWVRLEGAGLKEGSSQIFGENLLLNLQIWVHMWLGFTAIWNSVAPSVSSVVMRQPRGPQARQGCSCTAGQWKLNQVLIRGNRLGRISPACAEPGYMSLTICSVMRSCFRASTNNWELHSKIYNLYIGFSTLEWKFKQSAITGRESVGLA